MKKLFTIITALALTISAYGQADITGNMPVVELAGSTTNAGPGGGLIGWSIDQVAVVSASIIMTNTPHVTTLSNAVVRFDTSVNGTDWKTSAYSFSVAPATVGTNANTTIARMTNTVGAKWLRVGAVENVNTNRVYISRLMFHVQ